MHEGHSAAGWDAWGRPWGFINIAKRQLEGEDTWYHELPGGRVLIAVLVHHDQEPYFFPSARALLEALQRNACDRGMEIAPPTREGWTTNTQYEVEALLRPETYPPCNTVMNILRHWNGFTYSAQGYRDAVPMPTGETSLTLLDDSWDSPTEDFSALEESTDADTPRHTQIRAHENQSAHSRQEARNAAYLRDKKEARLKRELNEARTQLRQVESERDDAVGQLLDLQDVRRDLQAQLSTKAAELRVSQGIVKQLEADMKQLEIDLAEAHRLQRAATSGPVEMLPVPRVTHLQALATSVSRMTLGVAQPPASTAPVMQTVLMPAETTSIGVTGAQAIAQPADSSYTLRTMHGGCACHQPVEYIWYGRACPENVSRASRYHYQYHTYVPSPPPGYHVEDLPCPAAHEPG